MMEVQAAAAGNEGDALYCTTPIAPKIGIISCLALDVAALNIVHHHCVRAGGPCPWWYLPPLYFLLPNVGRRPHWDVVDDDVTTHKTQPYAAAAVLANYYYCRAAATGWCMWRAGTNIIRTGLFILYIHGIQLLFAVVVVVDHR